MDRMFIKKSDLNDWIAKLFNNEDISVDDLVDKIEDLVFELDSVKEEFEDYKQMIADNYEPRSKYKEYGINEEDFH